MKPGAAICDRFRVIQLERRQIKAGGEQVIEHAIGIRAQQLQWVGTFVKVLTESAKAGIGHGK